RLFQRYIVVVVQVVGAGYGIPFGTKPLAQVKPDEACSACNHNLVFGSHLQWQKERKTHNLWAATVNLPRFSINLRNPVLTGFEQNYRTTAEERVYPGAQA